MRIINHVFPGSSDASFGHVGSSNHTDKLVGLQNSGFNQNYHVFSGDVDHRATSSTDIVSNTPSFGLNDGSETRILLPLPPGRSPIPSIAAPPNPPTVAPHPMSAAVPSTPSAVVPRPMPAAVPSTPSSVVPRPMPAPVPSTPPAVIPSPPAVVPSPPAVAPPPPPPPINKAAPPPAPRPPIPNQKPGAQMPPPPPKAAMPPRQLHGNSRTKKPPNLAPSPPQRPDVDGDNNGPKTKLKPFFWDKVQANSQSNVWSQIRSGSFQ